MEHVSVAMEEIQARRKDKQIPGARRLHEYVNLYFDAHNPMLSRLRQNNDAVCVLRVHPRVLDLPEVVVADRNASSDWAHFHSVEAGLAALDSSRVFARYWTHDDPFEEMRHKSEKCAEVLVPDQVDAEMVTGAYVASETALRKWQRLSIALDVIIRADMFF
ncbi:MAG TPA: DUF4433 domain-containing protein [Candidatus Hydrogenedentes bacterium]|nr:DUF4433 domain-containing protein [Candidatus Hydrogenedentota bacterium]